MFLGGGACVGPRLPSSYSIGQLSSARWHAVSWRWTMHLLQRPPVGGGSLQRERVETQLGAIFVFASLPLPSARGVRLLTAVLKVVGSSGGETETRQAG